MSDVPEAEGPPVVVTHDGAVVTVTLSRPQALNAITTQMLRDLDGALEAIADDVVARVVVLTGEGRSFCAGVDLKALGRAGAEGGDVGDLNTPARSAIRRLGAMPQVTIAKVKGHCYTGGLELAIGCDLVVVAEDAKLADTHAKWGLRPTWGMSQRLPRLVGLARARELSYTARTFSGAEAAAWGLAARAVPAEALDGAVADLAAQVVANSGGSIAAYKDLYREAADRSLTDGLRYEAETQYRIEDSAGRIGTFG